MNKKIIGLMATLVVVALFIAGAAMNSRRSASAAIIGGADGPTAIFLAGKIGNGTSTLFLILGIVLLLAIVVAWTVRNRRK